MDWRYGSSGRAPTGSWWLTPVTVATQEVEVQSQTGEIVQETLSQKIPSQKRAGGVA
jgi:hypothetical protein